LSNGVKCEGNRQEYREKETFANHSLGLPFGGLRLRRVKGARPHVNVSLRQRSIDGH
jgi:hypothetical protein